MWRRFNGRLETDPRKLEDLRSAILADRAREFLAARTLENILHASEHKFASGGVGCNRLKRSSTEGFE